MICTLVTTLDTVNCQQLNTTVPHSASQFPIVTLTFPSPRCTFSEQKLFQFLSDCNIAGGPGGNAIQNITIIIIFELLGIFSNFFYYYVSIILC